MAASSVFRSGLFNHKVAIVTGGGTGIGKAISAELLELGESGGFLNLSRSEEYSGEITAAEPSELYPRLETDSIQASTQQSKTVSSHWRHFHPLSLR